MKKLILFTTFILVMISIHSQTQTLYVPNSLGGIGNSNTGNVGIGLNNPSEKLEIFNSATTPGIISLKSVRNDFSNVDVGRISAKQGTTEVARIGMPRAGYSLSGYLTFWTKTDNSSLLKESMRITSLGKVGIGETSPSANLEVKNPVTAHNKMLKLNSTGKGSQAYFIRDVNAGYFWDHWNNNGTTDFTLKYDALNSDPYLAYNGNFLVIRKSGKIGIGTLNDGPYKLAVNGIIRAKEIKVETGWADFVFDDNYRLLELEKLESFIKENKHLPEIPTATEVESDGINVGEMNAKLLQKIEELTLYTIEQQKQIEALKSENNAFKYEYLKELEEIKNQISK